MAAVIARIHMTVPATASLLIQPGRVALVSGAGFILADTPQALRYQREQMAIEAARADAAYILAEAYAHLAKRLPLPDTLRDELRRLIEAPPSGTDAVARQLAHALHLPEDCPPGSDALLIRILCVKPAKAGRAA